MSDHYYTVTPNGYKDGDYKTGTRRDRAETKAMYAELRKIWREGGDKAFQTKQEARVELRIGLKKIKSEYTQEDFAVCETCDFF
jgi:hypothetical protein